MGVIGQVWWLNLLLAGLTGLVLGQLFQALRERQARLAEIDAVHRRCWAEQDRWLEEHMQQSEAAETDRLDALARVQVLGQSCDEALQALARSPRQRPARPSQVRPPGSVMCESPRFFGTCGHSRAVRVARPFSSSARSRDSETSGR